MEAVEAQVGGKVGEEAGEEGRYGGELLGSEQLRRKAIHASRVSPTSAIAARGESGFIDENKLWLILFLWTRQFSAV
jgi:hypothetical protein